MMTINISEVNKKAILLAPQGQSRIKATAVMSGMMANSEDFALDYKEHAEQAVLYADALITEIDRTTPIRYTLHKKESI